MSDWASKTVVVLKEELKARGLPYQGKKTELVQRLEEAEAGNAAEPIEDAPATEDVVVEQPAIEVPATEAEIVEEQSNEAAVAAVEDEAKANSDAPTVEPQPAPSPVVESDMEQIVTGDPAPEGSTPQPITANEPLVIEEQSAAQTDTSDDSQKRKRRSASPIPHEDYMQRKRARGETGATDEEMTSAPIADLEPPGQQSMDIDTSPPVQPAAQEEMELDHSVAPAQHPATASLYISELMRPLRPNDIQAHLVDLAAAPGQAPNPDVIVKFYLDTIRTHAFVTFATSNAASRVRSALHNRVWPNESNRKVLKVDFIPAESVSSWIETEEASGGGRSGTRWEVIYQDGPDGIEARHVEAGRSNSKPGPPPRGPASYAAADPTIPTGPRDIGPPRGSRSNRSPARLQGDRTRARPSISFSLVPEDLARRRIDNMHSFYTKDTSRDYGREINRYSFEEGDSFVDRGKEVFEGIRPPHRERAVERERRGGRGRGGRRRGGKPGGFRPRSDRYFPGAARGGGGGGAGGGRRFEDDKPWDRARW